MNTYVLILKGTNKEMSSFEFEGLWKLYFNETIILQQLQNTYYYFTSSFEPTPDHEIFSRVTLTNYFGKLLYQGNSYEKYASSLKKVNFSFLENTSFAIEQHNSDNDHQIISSKELAAPIWNSLENPKVDLKTPGFKFLSLNLESQFLFIQLLFENKKEYLLRMPKLRPVAKPYTLKSDMARVAVNYLGLKEGKVLDPFCGIGGILLEAYDMGFTCYGNDISWNDLQHLKSNFNYYFNEPQLNLSICDAREQFLAPQSMDGIVTDIPYGRASRRLGLDLYDKFLKHAWSMLKNRHRLVVIYANFVEFRDLALNYFVEVKQIDQYINKSMTRHILILEKVEEKLK